MKLPFLKHIEDVAGSARKQAGVRIHPWPVFILGVVLLLVAFVFMSGGVEFALSLALFLAPVWLPFLLVAGAWELWVILKRSEFIAKENIILLEIKLPRNLTKTPLAMETVIAGLHITGGESNWYKKFILGSIRPWWSLEIASIEGQVHFYIWMRARLRRLAEAQFYSQYPGVQLVEATDYTRLSSAAPEEWTIWGCDYKQSKKDPVPIKTYVEYGLDKVQKEYEQTDPLANLVEFMGSIGKGEQLWVQFVIRAHKGEKYHKKNDEGKDYTWKDEAKELVTKIRAETRDKYVDPVTGEERPGFPNPTKGQIELMSAIERNISKQAFDVGIRSVYLAKEGRFNPSVISGVVGLFKQFSAEGEWNGIGPAGWMAMFDDYPWEFHAGKLKDKVRRALVEAYRRRQFFYEPFGFGIKHDEIGVMSIEEIATLFHIPSRAVETPTLGRIQSATSDAPANLPV